MAQNYDVSIEIFEAIHKEWDLFKKLYDSDKTLNIFVAPLGLEPGDEGVVCNIRSGLGVFPGAVVLRTKSGTLDSKGEECLEKFVRAIRKIPRIKVSSITDLVYKRG